MEGQGNIGSIPTFNQSVDDWVTYSEILDQFFVMNDVAEEKNPAYLIASIGGPTYKTLRDLCHPQLPKTKTFDELCDMLSKQFSPQIAIFRERSKFYLAVQHPSENVTRWYGRIKSLSVDCKFGDHLEAILLDKFITGLKNGQVLDRLCEENEEITLQKAVDIAMNKECSIIEGNSGH